jgi:hypothetical protein
VKPIIIKRSAGIKHIFLTPARFAVPGIFPPFEFYVKMVYYSLILTGSQKVNGPMVS